MNHRHRHLPRHSKTVMELAHRVTQGAKQLARIIRGRAQTPHQGLERLAFDIFHDHAKLVAHATAVDNPGQVLKTSSSPLCRKQALVCPANLSRRVDALAHKGTERAAARPLKVDEFSCLYVRTLKHTICTIAVVAVE